MPDSPVCSLRLPDEAATQALAARLAAGLSRLLARLGPTFQFHLQLRGDLGAGKTTFARALLRALGHAGRVKSPSYSLCEPYALAVEGRELQVYHFDLYRMADPGEWDDAGFRDCFGPGALCLVEWPEKGGDALARPDLELTLQPDAQGDSREATLRAHTASGAALLAAGKEGADAV